VHGVKCTSDGSMEGSVGDYAAVLYVGSSGINGWIDELRISKGVARWTADFTPETSAYSGASFSEAVTTSDVKTQDTTRLIPAESITISDAITKGPNKFITDNITLSELVRKDLVRLLSDTFNLTDVVNKLENRLLTDSVTISDLRYNGYTKPLLETVTITEARRDIAITRNILETLTLSEQINWDICIILTDSVITIVDVVNKDTVYHILTENIAATDAVQEWLNKSGKTTTWTTVSNGTGIWTLVSTSTDIWM